MSKQDVEESKFLSYVLRHNPGQIGVELDDQGWIDIDSLLAAMSRHRRKMSRSRLEWHVENNPKKRFMVSECGTRIRASQGHSIPIKLDYEPAQPPQQLYHGTATHVLEKIRAAGLTKQRRHHVHLSPDWKTATAVGKRHGKVVVLTVDAAGMSTAGHEFLVTPNEVWLTDHVPVRFIKFPDVD